MQKQMQSSVDKAVNAMAQRTWVGLTNEESEYIASMPVDAFTRILMTEAKLKEKNT
jgi:hypothetical protein